MGPVPRYTGLLPLSIPISHIFVGTHPVLSPKLPFHLRNFRPILCSLLNLPTGVGTFSLSDMEHFRESPTGYLNEGCLSPKNPTQPCPNPEQLRKLASLGLYYNQSPKPAIICIQCGFALKPGTDRISRHLGEKHNIPKQRRHGLNRLIQSLSLPDPTSLPLRPDWSKPHPHLAQHTGYCCAHCNKRSTSIEVISRHMNKAHAGCMIPKHPDRQLQHVKSDLLFQSWTNDI